MDLLRTLHSFYLSFRVSDPQCAPEESGDALFSDEKEIPAVQNGEVCIENAGQGMTSGTSVYNSKSSFGRRKTFPRTIRRGLTTENNPITLFY